MGSYINFSFPDIPNEDLWPQGIELLERWLDHYKLDGRIETNGPNAESAVVLRGDEYTFLKKFTESRKNWDNKWHWNYFKLLVYPGIGQFIIGRHEEHGYIAQAYAASFEAFLRAEGVAYTRA